MELKAESHSAEVRLKNPEQYQSIIDAEWQIIYSKLEKIVASGAKVVLSKLPIGDLATQYFADRGIFCAGRVETVIIFLILFILFYFIYFIYFILFYFIFFFKLNKF